MLTRIAATRVSSGVWKILAAVTLVVGPMLVAGVVLGDDVAAALEWGTYTPERAIAIVTLLGLLLLLLKSPRAYLMVWALLSVFFNYIAVYGDGESTIRLYAAASAVLSVPLVAKVFLSRSTVRFIFPLGIPYLGFLGVTIIAALLARGDTTDHIRVWLSYVHLFALSLLAARYAQGARYAMTMVVAICVVAVLFCLVSVYQYAFRIESISDVVVRTIQDAQADYIYRVASVTSYPSDLSLHLVVPIVLAYNFLLLDRHRLAWFVLPVLVAGLILTFTRSTLIATCIALFFSSLLRFRRRWSSLALLAAGLVTYLLVDWMMPGALTRDMSGDSGRMNIWSSVLDTVLSSPVLGHETLRSTHNIFLQILLVFGIPGLAAFGYLLWSMLRNIVSECQDSTDAFRRTLAVALLSIFVGYLVDGVFTSTTFFRTVYVVQFWVLLGVLWGIGARTASLCVVPCSSDRWREAGSAHISEAPHSVARWN